ncbi:DUF1330 domain-containing protein [Ruegeria sp. MALMAid1280]|uniref:DUF1330 domain-containing protein n=1 Tax=Ruegeria sp. MALMAid1280 TaxID=3411634 RepID=UPI003B9DD84C
MTAYVLVLSTPNPTGAESRQKYGEGVRPLLSAVGAKPLLRGEVVETLAGSEHATTAMVLRFTDTQTAKAFFEQDAYRDLIPHRSKGFRRMEILIIGEQS